MKKQFKNSAVFAVASGVIFTLIACGGDDGRSSESGNTAGTAAPKQTASAGTEPTPGGSKCGNPGDTGNALGVGRYCNGVLDCKGTKNAPLCSIAGDKDTHFCTKMCDPKKSAADECGSADMGCACDDSGQCGCTPSSCLN